MKKHMLIVDDSPSLREITRNFLTEIPNLQISEANDGLEAERILQESCFGESPVGLIILDWMMPNQSGIELLRKIRSTEQFQTLPKIIMLTAETYPDQIEACLKYKVSTYLTKPFTQVEIENAVKKALMEWEVLHVAA